MKKEKHLLWARNIFAFIVFVSLGVIVITEKGKDILLPKIEANMEEYLSSNYPELKDEVTKSKITFKNGQYQMKITSKKNKNLYFYCNQKKKEISDTYKKDYLEGYSLIQTIQKELEKEIEEKTQTSPSIEIIATLDKYTTAIKERILKEDHLLQLNFFKIKKEVLISDWNENTITEEIIKIINTYEEKEITPKSYTIIITNKNQIKESIEISNITSNFKENSMNKKIIHDILEGENTKLVKENKITFQYLNEEE